MCDFLLLDFEGEMCLILKKILQKTTCKTTILSSQIYYNQLYIIQSFVFFVSFLNKNVNFFSTRVH